MAVKKTSAKKDKSATPTKASAAKDSAKTSTKTKSAAKPKPKAAAKPKQSRHVTWMLKQRFVGEPDESTQRFMYANLMGHQPPTLEGIAAAQFAYGSRSGPKTTFLSIQKR